MIIHEDLQGVIKWVCSPEYVCVPSSLRAALRVSPVNVHAHARASVLMHEEEPIQIQQYSVNIQKQQYAVTIFNIQSMHHSKYLPCQSILEWWFESINIWNGGLILCACGRAAY
jgi:hypothetical protein